MMSGPTLSRTETARWIPVWRRCIGVALLIATCLGWLPAMAATFTVTILDDDGDGSLREAIAEANNDDGADTILFATGLTGTVVLDIFLPNITDPDGLTINGDNRITVSGNNEVRPFSVNTGASLSLENLTVSDGSTVSDGGGIRNSGTLTLTNSTLSGNSADVDFSGGGGIANFGDTVTLTNSTLSGNSADSSGGGIYNFGGTVILTASTLSGNSAGSGGGIHNSGGTATTTLTNSTLSGNSGGGIFNSSGTLALANSLIANSPSGGDCFSSSDGTVNDGGHNLVEDASCIDVESNGNLDGDPMLGPLADNGGPTQTHALNAGSIAIDAAGDCETDFNITADQRGAPRPIDGDGSGTAECDIGAYEFQAGLLFRDRFEQP